MAVAPNQSLFEQLLADTETRAAVQALREQYDSDRVQTAETDPAELADTTIDYTQLASLVLTGRNSRSTLPAQKVHVEYLKQSQLMKIPRGLGINPSSPAAGIAPTHETLVARY